MREKIILWVCFAIMIVDYVGSLLSHHLNYSYSLNAIVTICLYVSAGFLVRRGETLGSAMKSTALIGVFDATIGWWIVVQFGYPVGNKIFDHPTFLTWLIICITNALIAAFCGLLGVFVFSIYKKLKA